MLEGIEGLKLIKEDYYYNLDRTGALLLILGVMLVIIGLSLWNSISNCRTADIIFIIVAIIGMAIMISSVTFFRVRCKKYILTPIEEHYSIDLNKYIIDSESDGNLIVIRERQLYKEGEE